MPYQITARGRALPELGPPRPYPRPPDPLGALGPGETLSQGGRLGPGRTAPSRGPRNVRATATSKRTRGGGSTVRSGRRVTMRSWSLTISRRPPTQDGRVNAGTCAETHGGRGRRLAFHMPHLGFASFGYRAPGGVFSSFSQVFWKPNNISSKRHKTSLLGGRLNIDTSDGECWQIEFFPSLLLFRTSTFWYDRNDTKCKFWGSKQHRIVRSWMLPIQLFFASFLLFRSPI